MEQLEAAGGSEALFDLINIIRQDPSIWDRASSSFITHTDLKIHKFAEIAEQLNLESVTAEVVALAWRELSEKYRRRLYDGKRRNGATNWPYFEAMSFLRDQYEQTKWYRPLTIPRSVHFSSSSNFSQLVDTFLTAQAVIDAEQSVSKNVEPMLSVTLSDSLQVARHLFLHTIILSENKILIEAKGNAMLAVPGSGDERKNEFGTKYELIDPSFHSFSATDQNELNGNVDVDNIAIASAADSTKSPETYDEKQTVSPAASVDGLTQNGNHGVLDGTTASCKGRLRTNRYEVYRNPRRIWKHQKQSLFHQASPAVTSGASGTSSGEAVAEILRSVRASSSDDSSSPYCVNPSTQLIQQQGFLAPDNPSKWENVGRVWIDMMKSIRSSQLALAAHKYIINTLFSVLEADQQLLGTDPNTTRVRIRDVAPQIEITMHQ
ncbi:unnamed protein product [Thelazia callipaeda]|uniref:MADF domain-containing protein n=1 Tax=Thelazia callipaeda TaxID=103827 RepID=A0A0N5D9K1_THECL|nr:unnamed protein product [Thelazia callipaeda]